MARMERELAAYHEAGHAVAAYLFMIETGGLALDDRCLWPSRPWEQDDGSIESAESQILLALAGPAAERKLKGTPELSAHSTEDSALAQRLSAEMQAALIGNADERLIQAHLCYLDEKVRCLFDDPGVWTAVEALAKALLTSGSLPGDEVREIVAGVFSGTAVGQATKSLN
jgi:hypothetical protein